MTPNMASSDLKILSPPGQKHFSFLQAASGASKTPSIAPERLANRMARND